MYGNQIRRIGYYRVDVMRSQVPEVQLKVVWDCNSGRDLFLHHGCQVQTVDLASNATGEIVGIYDRVCKQCIRCSCPSKAVSVGTWKTLHICNGLAP